MEPDRPHGPHKDPAGSGFTYPPVNSDLENDELWKDACAYQVVKVKLTVCALEEPKRPSDSTCAKDTSLGLPVPGEPTAPGGRDAPLWRPDPAKPSSSGAPPGVLPLTKDPPRDAPSVDLAKVGQLRPPASMWSAPFGLLFTACWHLVTYFWVVRDGKCAYKGHMEWRSVTQWILTGRGAPPTPGRNFIDKVRGPQFADSSYKDPTPADSRRWSDGGRLERLCKP